MAYCPECNGEMGERDAVCPHCGYDFPVDDSEPIGFIYSTWADVVLIIAAIIAALTCLSTAFAAVAFTLKGDYLNGLLYCPAIACLFLAQVIVFFRVQNRR